MLDQLRRQPVERRRMLHKGIVLGGGVLGGVAARRLLATVWTRTASTSTPPLVPDRAGVSWKEATTWAVASGVAAGVSRMLARRLATTALGAA